MYRLRWYDKRVEKQNQRDKLDRARDYFRTMKTLKIAISGKGGVGKTLISAILSKLFANEGRNVLLIDADSTPNLAPVLGIKHEITPISRMFDLIVERTGKSNGLYILNPKVDDIPERYGIKIDNITLVVVGTIRTAEGGCFCPESALLKNLLRYLVFDRYEILIMDTEAGMEHIGRGVAKRFDYLVVVVEPSIRSVKIANDIGKFAKSLDIRNVISVLNKLKNNDEVKVIRDMLEFPLVSVIPYEENMEMVDLSTESVFDRWSLLEMPKCVDNLKTYIENMEV
jgi:CO dehydrogenase maturation factor